jgi:3-hydroxyacyl-[acyl-carrier-protein] dehydratase
MVSQRCEAWICIPQDHPALPGHFPGAPVVPGVVVLDELLGAAERQLGRALTLAGLPQAKFLSPLLPAQQARCVIEIEGARLAFRIEHEGRLIARGSLMLTEPAAGGPPAVGAGPSPNGTRR